MAALPLALAAGAAATTAYLNARLSLEHDALFVSIFGTTAIRLIRSVRAGRVNVFYELERQAQIPSQSARPFLIFEGHTWSYGTFYETVLRCGHWLRTVHGVKPREVVALDFQNSDTFVLLWFGLWSIGAVPAFINHHLTGAPLVHSLRTSTATLALVDPRVTDSLTDGVRGEFPNMRFLVVTRAVEDEIVKMEAVRYPDEDRAVERYVDLAILIYTSGTTGLPKPAVMSWAKIYVASTMANKGMQLTKDDIFYLVCATQNPHLKRKFTDRPCSPCHCTIVPPLASGFAVLCLRGLPYLLAVDSRPRRSGRRYAKATRRPLCTWARPADT